ncbi:MAG: transposase [Flavobacteriaceae bacterium]|nr:transposase [Flavobacteriaceae bacterium]
MNKYQNKYRIPSTRLQNWNYGAMGSYFITICTRNREHFFGKIIKNEMGKNEMILNNIGKNAEEEWLKTIELRPDMNLELGNFVVMPNHFHAILIIGENEFNSGSKSKSDLDCRDAMHCVSTTTTTNKFGPQSKNLGSIMRGFKSSVTTYSKKDALHCASIDFGWQPRFHDHIVRNTAEFERIQNYIANNIENWKEDKFYK